VKINETAIIGPAGSGSLKLVDLNK
jgi:hypothetical protein